MGTTCHSDGIMNGDRPDHAPPLELMRRLALILLLAALPARAAQEHMICLSADGVFHYQRNCEVRDGLRSEVRPAEQARRFIWASRSQHAAAVGVLPAGATTVGDLVDATCCTIAIPDSVVGPDDEDATVVLRGTSGGTWTFTLDPWWFREGRLNIRVPRDAYTLRITTGGGKTLFDGKGPDFGRRAALSVKGRAVAKDERAPADFAQITDCRRAVCTADAEGRFRCAMRERPRAICVEHPELGRARVELEGRTGDVDLETVALQPGGAIRVIRPLHVELPAGTKLALRRGPREIREPQAMHHRDEVDLLGLEPGRYDVLLAGPEPLQRKRFTVEVRDRALEELHLSLDAYRLTGEVQYRDRPLGGAEVSLHGELAEATLQADQSGRFSAELWEADSFGVTVDAAVLAQPWGVMKRASVTDNEWRLVVPSRKIAGKVIEAETGKAVSDANIAVESSTHDGTRWSRNVRAGEDGTFEISGVGEGRYLLTVRQPSFLTSEPMEVAIGESGGDPRVTLTIHRGVDVPLLVVDGSGVPLAGATILSELSSGGERANRMTLSDANGRAALALRPKSTGTVYVIARNGGFASADVVADDTENEVRIGVPAAAGALSFLAVSADDGQPLAGLPLALRYNGQPVPRAVVARLGGSTTDTTGRLLLPALPAGVYEFAFAGAWQRVEVGGGATTVVTQRLARR
jgi:Carboxypeptidase regulatory-like domain